MCHSAMSRKEEIVGILGKGSSLCSFILFVPQCFIMIKTPDTDKDDTGFRTNSYASLGNHDLWTLEIPSLTGSPAQELQAKTELGFS